MSKDMAVIQKAKVLNEYTFVMTKDKNRYPKSWSFVLTNRIQNLSLDICGKLRQTNELLLKDRLRMLAEILGDLETMLFLIEFSLKEKRIDDRQAEIWTEKTEVVKKMTAAWKNKYM